jgi:hypothetical protein
MAPLWTENQLVGTPKKQELQRETRDLKNQIHIPLQTSSFCLIHICNLLISLCTIHFRYFNSYFKLSMNNNMFLKE